MQGYVFLKESRKPMAQNVEEIAQILSRLQEENKINSDDVNRVLIDIKSKVDDLTNNSDESSLIIDGLKKAFDLKSSVDIEKFSEFSNSLDQIKTVLSDNISADDYNRFLETIRSLEANFKQAVSGLNYDKQSFFESIQSEIGRIVEKSVILQDLFPQKEKEALDNIAFSINENINNIKNDLNQNLTTDLNLVAEGVSSVITRIEVLKNEIAENVAVNINEISNDVKTSSVNFIKELDELKSVLNRNFDDNSQVLSALNDADFKITSIIKTSEQSVNENIIGIKSDIDGLYSKFDDIKNELKMSSEENLNKILESINRNSEHIIEFKENVSGHLIEYLSSIKDLFVAFSEDMKNTQETLASDIFDKKLQELEVLSKDINNLDANLALKEDGYKSYVTEKIDDLKVFITTVQDIIKNSDNEAVNILSEKITTLENTINNNNILKDEKLENLYRNLEDYSNLVQNFTSNTDIRFGETISEITEIKDYIANTAIKLDDVQNNISGAVTVNGEQIEELKNTVSLQLNNVTSKLFSLGDDIKKEINTGSDSFDGLKDEINTNISSNFNDVKTILECMRANVSQCSDNMNVKIDEFSGSVSGNHDEVKTFLNNLNEAISKTQALIDQNTALGNDKYIILEQALKTNIKNIEDVLTGKTEQCSQQVSDKIDIIEGHLNSIKLDLDEKLNSSNDDTAEQINESLQTIRNDINQNIKEDYNSVAQSIGALLLKLETVKSDITSNNAAGNSSLEQSVIANIQKTEDILSSKTEQSYEEIAGKIGTIAEHLSAIKSDLDEKLSSGNDDQAEKINESLQTLKLDINQNIKEDFNSVAQSIGALLARIETVKSDISKTSTMNYSNLEQSVIANLKVAEEAISAKSLQYNQEVSEKIDDISEHINAVKTDIAELYNGSNTDVAEKLLLVETKLGEISDEYEQNLAMLQAKLGEYVSSVDKISTETNIKLDSSASEFIDIKTDLKNILEQITNIQDEQSQEFADRLSGIINKLDEVADNINSSKDDIKADVKEVLQENINFIDKGLGYLTLNLDEIKSKQSENCDIFTNTLTDKIRSIKQEIELVNTDVVSAINTKSEEFIKEFEPLKEAVDKFLEFDFAAVINEIKNQVELSYLNLLSELNDNLIENHDAYIRIENTYKDIVSRCSSLEDYINGFTKDNLELINSSIANIDLTVRSNLDKTNMFIAEWQKNIEAIDQKFADNRASYEHSLVDILEQVRNTLDTKINSGNEELKECLAVMLNNEDLMYTLESLGGDLTSKIDDFKANLDDSSDSVQSAISELNKDISGKLDIVKLELQNQEDTNNKAVELASAINNQIKNVLEIIDDKFDNSFKTINEKIDILAMEDNTEIIDTIQSLHSKVDILAMEDNTEIQDELAELRELLIDQKKLLEQDAANEEVNEKINELIEKIGQTAEGTDKVSEMLKVLHEKVDVLAMSDDTDIRDEIDDIKNLIYAQRKLFEELGDNEKAHEIDNYLRDLLAEINKIEKNVSGIDLEKNARDIKDSVMTAILSVTDQISFVEETEEIKDFVEEKTNAINKTLLDVKKQLSNIASSSSDMDFYSYTLQDVESDIAKLRLILNDISTAKSSDEVGVISTNINRIVKSIEDLRSSLTHEESFELKSDFEKLNEDILSISARTNKLLLNSDEAYRIICDSLDEFNRRTSNLEDRINVIDNKKIENHLAVIDQKVNETMNSNKILQNVMMYLGEWMDGTTETISSIYEKTAKVSSMEEALDELKETVPEKEALIKTIEDRFEEQQSRIDRLEKKLEKAISLMEEQDENLVLNKIDKLETQLSKLSLNIEKLASYVDE